ncbi:MAG: glucose-6-phosphate isomerase [Armatimonadota bacterium]|jgi:glucose-6-phosphate isomerase
MGTGDVNGAGWRLHSASLGDLQARVDHALAEVMQADIASRIWARDHTVWKPEPKEISNRLGWLDTAEVMAGNVRRLRAFAEEARNAGYKKALLFGMGGSSLAPEVFRKTYGVSDGFLDLAVLDSTDPGAVLAYARTMPPSESLFIVSSKSGSTVEPLSLFKYFYNWVMDAVGRDQAGEHFVAITDPGSGLAALADKYRFRATFLNDPNIGGRYSALSHFGLVPAALAGVDIGRVLESGVRAMNASRAQVPPRRNLGLWLGVVIGEAARAGRDKATFVLSPEMASFGDWLEQLLAESTGKEGTGVLPVVGEPLGNPEVYGSDRLFVQLRLWDDAGDDGALEAIEQAGHPVLRIWLRDTYDLGGQFFLWELATAVAGQRLGINPFDQPDVDSAKEKAREMAKAYSQTGALPAEQPAAAWGSIQGYGELAGDSPRDALRSFIAGARDPSYVSLQAYVQPTVETDASLASLRMAIRDESGLAVTVGYGPRFLHSTGQLHKGDAGRGLFIQLTADDAQDAPIPDEAGSPASSLTFGVLKAAQAMGDRQALADAGRRVIRFHLGGDVVAGIRRLAGARSERAA